MTAATPDPFDYGAALDRAADRVARGWCQGIYGDKDGNVCLHGAVGVECGRRIDRSDGSYFLEDPPAVADALHDRMKKALSFLTIHDSQRWNDMPGRTQDDVVFELRCAAHRARTEAKAEAHANTPR